MKPVINPEYQELVEAIAYVLLSLVCYRILQFAVRWYLFGKCTFRTFSYFQFNRLRRRRNRTPPDSQSLQNVPPNKKWRICNEVVSLIHSVVSGLWALYVILYYHVHNDMIYFRAPDGMYLIYMSFGYIVHDLIDLLINERSMRIVELLFHHVVVLVAFFVTLFSGKFLAVVIFGLLMELNSIFLHSRSLLNLYRHPKKSVGFRIIALLNIVTFMIFRMAVSAFLIKWQVVEVANFPWWQVTLNFLVIFSLAATNTVLCYRVMAADGLFGKKRARGDRPVDTKSEDTPTNEEEDDDEEDENYEDDASDDVESGDGANVDGQKNALLTTVVSDHQQPVVTTGNGVNPAV